MKKNETVEEIEETKQKIQQIVSQIIILCGVFLVTWLFVHMIYNAIFGIEYNYASSPSIWRLILGLFLILLGWVMLKMINFQFNIPRMK